MDSSEPVRIVVKQTILGVPAKEISRQLQVAGLNVDEKRVRAIQKKIGEEVFEVIRQEFLEDSKRTILDYRQQILTVTDLANRRFLEANAAYEGFMATKSKSLTALFEEFQQDPNPNIQDYVMKANALQEGMNLQKLSVVMKNISGDLAKWTEIAAKMDQKIGMDTVNVAVNMEAMVERIYSVLCDECREKLSGN